MSRHEDSGLTIPVNDPSALAAAANRLLQEPGLRERLATTARERAEREYDHRVIAERCLEVYRRVLGCPSGSRPRQAVMVNRTDQEVLASD